MRSILLRLLSIPVIIAPFVAWAMTRDTDSFRELLPTALKMVVVGPGALFLMSPKEFIQLMVAAAISAACMLACAKLWIKDEEVDPMPATADTFS